MTRKSKIVTLSILGAIAAFGVFACCCTGWFHNDPVDKDGQDNGAGAGRGGHVTDSHRYRWFPIFFGGGSAPGPGRITHTGGGSSSTSRGGFGSTGAHGGGAVGG